jgi:hypothetical protein
MRPMRLKVRAIAAWFGLIAFGLNALVPVHLVFGRAAQFVDARECGHYEGKAIAWRDPGWWALALLTGQDETRDPSHSHKGLHPAASVVCGIVSTLADAMPAAAAVLPLPLRFVACRLSPVMAESAPSAPIPAAYRSRAPPEQG